MRFSGQNRPASPVVISIPHAGRAYPPELADMVRLPLALLKPLEDRYADLLAADAEKGGHAVLIAETPRCWIDLNRAEDEIDPLLTPSVQRFGGIANAKIRAGLGLIPRRLAVGGDIWRQPISRLDVDTRIDRVHRPWHRALSAALDNAAATFGCAVLIDLHSMPTLQTKAPPQIVVGDRFGKSASRRLSQTALSTATLCGYRSALNAPYAGGHTLDRHGAPVRHVHALQVEVDRSLYLDRAHDRPTAGLAEARAFVAQLADALAQDVLSIPFPIAAE